MSIPHGTHSDQMPSALASDKLPGLIDIFAFARTGEQLSGQVRLAQLLRVQQEVANDAPACDAEHSDTFQFWCHGVMREEHRAVEGDLTGKTQTQQRLFLKVKVNCGLWLTCQRCLQPYWQPLVVENTLEIMRSEAEADAAPMDDDEVDTIVGTREFDLIALLEDELLLVLPLAPKHIVCDDDTVAKLVKLEAEEGEADADAEISEEPVAKRPNPFAILAGLKTGKKP